MADIPGRVVAADQVEEIRPNKRREVGLRTDLPPPHEEAPVDVGPRFGSHQSAEELGFYAVDFSLAEIR